jgi:hypothetical protein
MIIVIIAIRIKDASPPRRGELRTLSIVNDRGGLPSSEQNDEECDATDDHSSNTVWQIKKYN